MKTSDIAVDQTQMHTCMHGGCSEKGKRDGGLYSMFGSLGPTERLWFCVPHFEQHWNIFIVDAWGCDTKTKTGMIHKAAWHHRSKGERRHGGDRRSALDNESNG